MKYKKVHLHAITFLLTIMIIVGLSAILYRNKTSDISPTSDLIKEKDSLKTAHPYPLQLDLPVREKVRPARPQELGITVYYEDNKPKTQEEWNAFISESYREARKDFEQENPEKLEGNPYKQLDEKNLKEVNEKTVQLDEKIAECEKKLKDNPDDENSKRQLENWQTMKALLVAVYGEGSSEE